MITRLSEVLARLFPRARTPGIDMGGGRLVAPEDLLEGHYRRLAAGPTPYAAVQVSPALHSVIQVAAPTLAPLTQIAEQVAVKLPTVQPAPGFRSQLHQALEEEHKRRLAQSYYDQPGLPSARTWATVLATMLVAMGVATLLLVLLKKRAQ